MSAARTKENKTVKEEEEEQEEEEEETLAGGPGLQVASTQTHRWKCADGCAPHGQKRASAAVEWLLLADTFPAQKPQDCVVVGGGEQIEKLEDGDVEEEGGGRESMD